MRGVRAEGAWARRGPETRRQAVALLVVGLALLAGRPAAAQAPTTAVAAPRAVQLGIGLVGAAPVGDFATFVDSAGGVAGSIGVGVGGGLVSLGGEVAYLVYGTESRRVPLSTTLPDILVEVDTENAILLAHGRVRLQPPSGRWRPYADGLLGFNYIYTRTSIDTAFDISGGPSVQGDIFGTTNLDDFGLSYGTGGGVMVGFGSPPSRLMLDIGIRYVAGSEADYLTEGAIRRENGVAILDVTRSRTDLVTVFIGVAWSSR